MADIEVIVSPATVTTVEVPSSVAAPSVLFTGVQGPPGADGTNGNSFDQSLNTTDSPTFVSLNLFDPINQADYTGGISLGFTGNTDGILFNATGGDGSFHLKHPPFDQTDYVVSLPSASGTLALTSDIGSQYDQSLNTTDSPTFASVHTSDGTLSGGIWPGFDADKTGVYFEDTHGGSIYIHSSLTSGVDYSQTLQSASGTIALTSDIPSLASLGGQAAGNYATLVGGLVPASQLPSYVDDVLEYAGTSNFPTTGETGKIYVATGSGKIYRWTGSIYVEISPSTAQVQSDWNASSGLGVILNKPTLFSGSYTDLTSKPSLATVATSGSYNDLTSKPTLGTAASKDIPATGNASATQVVYGSDTRLTDSRTPSSTLAHKSTHATGGSDSLSAADIGAAAASHTHTKSQITDFPTLGTASAKDIPATGNASATQVVYGSDTRLTDSRTPSVHASSHANGGSDALTLSASQITGLASVATSGAYSALSGTPSLATVATSGSYTDLSNLPVIAKKSTADLNSTNTTLADVTGLTNFVLEANTMYRFEFAGRHTCVSGGSQYLVLNSTQAISNASAQGWYVIFGSRTDAGFSNPSGNLYAFINRQSTGNTNNPSAAVYYIMTGSSAPTMKIQFSQTGTATGTSTLLSGAVAIFTKLI